MEKVRELDAEKMKTEKAFHDFLPTSVVRDMKRNKVKTKLFINENFNKCLSKGGEATALAEHFECVTIFFGDIIGFSGLISDCTANEVAIIYCCHNFLSHLFIIRYYRGT